VGTAAAAEICTSSCATSRWTSWSVTARFDPTRSAAAIGATEPRAHITCEVIPQYRNMRYWLENDMRPVDMARQGLSPICGHRALLRPAIRGGTDGSRLTEKGVPTPNLFTGMQNDVHGPLEWVSVQDMARATEMCVKLAECWGAAEG
jgi:tripeptide aminopeptidase